jgi:hypothetical protein
MQGLLGPLTELRAAQVAEVIRTDEGGPPSAPSVPPLSLFGQLSRPILGAKMGESARSRSGGD